MPVRCGAFALVLITACLGMPMGAQTPSLTYEREFTVPGGWPVEPRTNGEFTIFCDRNHSSTPLITIINREGVRDELLFRLEDAALIHIYDVAISLHGEVALVGSAYTTDQRGTTFIARIASDHEAQTVIRSSLYVPSVVTFDTDGTIWVIGLDKDRQYTGGVRGRLLRHFDGGGRLLKTTAFQSRELDATDNITHLRASRDRIGWLTGPEYIEFSESGAEIARYDGPDGAGAREISGMGMSEDNLVITCVVRNSKAKLYWLDRPNRMWRILDVPKEHSRDWMRVLGFDGPSLIMSRGNGDILRFSVEEK